MLVKSGFGFFLNNTNGIGPMTPEGYQVTVVNPLNNIKMQTEKAAAIKPIPNQLAVEVLSECQKTLEKIMSKNSKDTDLENTMTIDSSKNSPSF